MKKYVVTTRQNLRQLCIDHDWFTAGDNEQYEKLFYANEHPEDYSLKDIASIIWVCSDCERINILGQLYMEMMEYWSVIFNISIPYKKVYRFWNVYGEIMECTFQHFMDIFSDPDVDDWNYDTMTMIDTADEREVVWKSGEEE